MDEDYGKESYDEEAVEKEEFFDRLLESRYDAMVEDMLKNGAKN